MRRERVDQLAECRIDRLLMPQAGHRRALAPARCRAALRPIGRLVPAEHGADRPEIADLEQTLPEFDELLFGGATVRRAFCTDLGLERTRRRLRLARSCLFILGFGGSGLGTGGLLHEQSGPVRPLERAAEIAE